MKKAPAMMLLCALTNPGIGIAQESDDEVDGELSVQPPDPADFEPPDVFVGSAEDAEPPQIASSGDNVFIIWHEFVASATPPDVFLARSTNGGDSFSAPVNLSNSFTADSRGEDIAVSRRNVFVVWSEEIAGVQRILLRRSTNNGRSFASPQTLSVAEIANNPQVVVSGDDVYVAWEALGQGNQFSDIFVARSEDGGRNFSAERNISNNDGTSERPELALSDGRAIVTWRDDSIAGFGFEILYARED
jgi:hypothetical protein